MIRCLKIQFPSQLRQARFIILRNDISPHSFLSSEPIRPRTGHPPAERRGWLTATKSPYVSPEMHQALTFLATFQIDAGGMKTLAVISILALLAISGGAYTDRLFTGDQQTTQRAN